MFLLFFPLSAQALSVKDVRFGVHPDKTRLVLDLSAVSDFRVFVLNNPYRVVVDLPSLQWQAGSVDQVPGSGVRDVRHGTLQEGISRIVFDLDRPIALRSAFVLPAQSGRSDRLVIDFVRVDIRTFQAEKSKVLGTLEVVPSSAATGSKIKSQGYKTASVTHNIVPPEKPEPVRKPLVVIDPGHGGVDPGAVGPNGIRERDIVLALAKELKKQLEKTGRYKVMMTRESNVFIKLYDRVKFAKRHKADLFVSIHADSIGKSTVRGASVYTLSEKASDRQTAKLAARENKADLIAGVDLNVEDQEVAGILVDLAMRDTMNQSKYFANTLVDNFRYRGVRLLERPHRYAGFAVLKAPDIPSVLVEAGFISNHQEAVKLKTPKYRRKIAGALRDGIDAYFKTVAENERS